jgi:hypothetical protein
MSQKIIYSQSTVSKEYSKNALKAYKEQYIYDKESNYPSISASEINSFLRSPYYISDSGKPTKRFNDITVKYISKIICSIDKQLTPSIDTDTIYYRGIPMNIYNSIKSLPDKIMTNKAYTSCTKNINVAKDFAGKKGAVIYFKIPDNIKIYTYKDRNGKKDDEEETLIQRNTQFILHPHTEKIENGYTIAYVTLEKYTSTMERIYKEYFPNPEIDATLSRIRTQLTSNTNEKPKSFVKIWENNGENIIKIIGDMKNL